MNKTGLIIIPYAYGGNTGVSIQNVERQLDTYMKNICTAALSAKKNSGGVADVMVVCNITIPEYYNKILTDNGILTEQCPFDKFNFGNVTKEGKTVSWQLAFYKLCALEHCIEKFDYDNFCFIDSDVFVQGPFDKIWAESANNILMYDLCEPTDGYMVKEMQMFLNTRLFLSHMGGEFYASSRQLARDFIKECTKVFDDMNASGYMTSSGDEFISSIAAHCLKVYVKNAGTYVRRYWTGSYRLICNDYDKNKIVVLHLPAEKEQGILKIFDRYISKGIVPSNQRAWVLSHLKHRSLRVWIGILLRRLHVVN